MLNWSDDDHFQLSPAPKTQTMPSEETPLLAHEQDRDAVYTRFTPARKKAIVAVVSWAGLLSCKFQNG